MQKIKIYTIGKIKNKNLRLEIEELLKRLPKVEVIELKEIKNKNIEILKKKEFELITKHIEKSCFNVLLWEFGQMFDTKKFYEKFKSIYSQINIFITGAYGPSNELKDIVDLRLSLSSMTFTHEQALYLLVEQLYRVQCLDKNIDYTK